MFHSTPVLNLKQRVRVERGLRLVGGSRLCSRKSGKWGERVAVAALAATLLPGLERGFVLLELVAPVGVNLEAKKHRQYSKKHILSHNFLKPKWSMVVKASNPVIPWCHSHQLTQDTTTMGEISRGG